MAALLLFLRSVILGDFLVNFEWNQVGLFNVNGNKTSSPVTNGIGQIWFFLIIPFCYSLFALCLKDERNISSKNQTNNGETSRNAKWIHVRVRVLGEKGGGGARGLLSPTFRRRDVTCGVVCWLVAVEWEAGPRWSTRMSLGAGTSSVESNTQFCPEHRNIVSIY